MSPITKHHISLVAVLAVASTVFYSCNANRTVRGGVIGSTTGAAIGALIGEASDNTAVGAIIGAGIGGTAGALIGREMDNQAEELAADLEGATVERVGEGIHITFEEGINFAVNSDVIQGDSQENLQDLSRILMKYHETDLLIEGHTDASGDADYNLNLSLERATSVATFLDRQGVDMSRISTVGYGESHPIASNEDAEGRQLNRRVEVAIVANKRMQRAAKRGDLDDLASE